jgi:TonB family protein
MFTFSSSLAVNAALWLLIVFSIQIQANEVEGKYLQQYQSVAELPKTKTHNCFSHLSNYLKEALTQGTEGTIKIKVHLSTEGYVTEASIAKSSGYSILDEGLLTSVYDCKFEPMKKDGIPVDSTIFIPIRFKSLSNSQ